MMMLGFIEISSKNAGHSSLGAFIERAHLERKTRSAPVFQSRVISL